MILSFSDTETEKVWNGERSRKLPADIQDRALIKLRMLNQAETLDDLRNPARQPSPRAEGRPRRPAQHYKQWRISFVWRDGGADGVEITDYH